MGSTDDAFTRSLYASTGRTCRCCPSLVGFGVALSAADVELTDMGELESLSLRPLSPLAFLAAAGGERTEPASTQLELALLLLLPMLLDVDVFEEAPF